MEDEMFREKLDRARMNKTSVCKMSIRISPKNLIEGEKSEYHYTKPPTIPLSNGIAISANQTQDFGNLHISELPISQVGSSGCMTPVTKYRFNDIKEESQNHSKECHSPSFYKKGVIVNDPITSTPQR